MQTESKLEGVHSQVFLGCCAEERVVGRSLQGRL